MNWTRVTNGYHVLQPDPPAFDRFFRGNGNSNLGAIGSVQEMAGGWWKARVFTKPGHLESNDDLTHRFEELADAKTWVAVTCKLKS